MMRTHSSWLKPNGLFILALLIILGGCRSGGPERGHDPWVFRSVLDWQPRMITMALDDNLWVSYNTTNAALYRVWADGVSFEGPVYNQSHGPQPVSLGKAYFVMPEGSPWQVESAGNRSSPEVSYGGHQFHGDEVELFFDLRLSDGQTVHVTEMPHIAEDGKFSRTFEVSGVPENTSVLLTVSGASLGDGGITSDGDLQVASQEDGSASGYLVLNNGGTTVLTYDLDSAPTVTTIISAPGDDDETVDNPGLALIESADCSICHNATMQTVGPSYTAIAEKYLHSSYNISQLAKKVQDGGSGVWGAAIMTPHPDLSREEAEEMVAYIMSLDGEPLADDGALSSRDAYPLDESYDPGDSGQGVVVNAYRFDEIDGMPVAVGSLTPVASFVAEGINAPTDGDFGNLSEDFYLEISGSINIQEEDNYVFRLISDDGSLMYLDDELIIDNDGFHGPEPADGEMFLSAGAHPFVIKFFQGRGGKALALQWVKHGDEVFSTVPAEVFSYDPAALKETAPYVPPKRIAAGIPGDGRPLTQVHPAYDLKTIRPDNFQPMVGGLDIHDGDVYVSTWDPEGAVYRVSNIDGDRADIEVEKIASGLLEPLGLKVVDGEIYVLQKHELTRLRDTDSDGIIDRYETVCSGWGVSSNFHEFAFGLVYQDGHFYATLATAILPGGASADPQVADRGRVIRIDPTDGSYEFIAEGLRTPNGIGVGVDNEIFVSDNQGDWLPSSKIMHVSEGAFFGSRSVDFEGTASKSEKQPVVWLPQDEIGNSPSQPALLNDGPYAGQMMHGEVTHGGLKRVFVEQVDGEYQGALFRFVQGLEAGVNRVVAPGNGDIYIGGIGNPGNWGQDEKQWYGLQKLTYNGASVFEMLAVRAKSNGMEIEFTEPVATSVRPSGFLVQQWKYVPTKEYGGPKVDLETLEVVATTISADRKRIFLEIDGLRAGSVVYIYLDELLRNDDGEKVWSTEVWYTLNRIPAGVSTLAGTTVRRANTVNTLTAAEREAGWELMFDGRSMAGWHRYGGGQPGDAWKVQDGSIVLGGDVQDWQFTDGGDIVSDAEFSDFEMVLEWRISPGGNSGIFYNVVEDTSRFSYPWQSGPEYQLLDDEVHSDGQYVKHRTGDLYDMKAAAAQLTRPVGMWNTTRIRQEDGTVQHWLNGELLLEYETGTASWTEMIEASKFGDMEGFGSSVSGRIGLQDHGNEVAFRNIKVQRLN